MTHETITISPGSDADYYRVDALQIVSFPVFAEGVLLPADEIIGVVHATIESSRCRKVQWNL